jgi:hypothetical protein
MLNVLPIVLSKLHLRDRGRAMQVSRAWRAAGRDVTLWRDLDLRTHRLTPALVSSFSSWCARLRGRLRRLGVLLQDVKTSRDVWTSDALDALSRARSRLATRSCGALEHVRLGGRDNALQACRLRAPALRAIR